MTTKTGAYFPDMDLAAAPAAGETINILIGGRSFSVTRKVNSGTLRFLATGQRGATYGLFAHMEQTQTKHGITTLFGYSGTGKSAPAAFNRIVLVEGLDGKEYIATY
jgi:hypothetical protein